MTSANMRKMVLAVAATALGCVSASAAPDVVVTSVSQSDSRMLTVTYNLSGEDAVVTLGIETNTQADASGEWVSIGAENIKFVSGDANRKVTAGTGKTIMWAARKSWPDHNIKTPTVRAVVRAWALTEPPDYMVLDLKGSKVVRYYEDVRQLPAANGIDDDLYRTSELVMRRVHAKNVEWYMGSPSTELGRNTTDWDALETRHAVTLTNDYYLAVYPTTLRHHALLRDGTAAAETRLSPAIELSYNMLRYAAGNNNNTALPINFPGTTHRTQVGGSSLLRAFRNRTGLELDLPTSAQWEFACRAGSDTPIYTHPTVSDGTMANLNYIAASYGEVGRMGCNNWYLYDMLGNVYEWCLDYFEDQITADAVVDPLGPLSESQVRRKIRGYHDQRIHWRSSFFSGSAHLTKQTVIGYRLCITLP